MNTPRLLLLALALTTLSACGGAPMAAGPGPAPAPGDPAVGGTLTGQVLNGEGRPMPNMEVQATHDATESTVSAMTDAQGRYRIALPARPGTWQAEAIIRISEGGDLLAVPDDPEDRTPFSASGTVVRNFVYLNGYSLYGAVDVGVVHSAVELNGSLELTLRPVHPNVLGEVNVLKVQPRKSALEKTIIPLGLYEVTAEQTLNGEHQHLLIQTNRQPTPAATAVAGFIRPTVGDERMELPLLNPE